MYEEKTFYELVAHNVKTYKHIYEDRDENEGQPKSYYAVDESNAKKDSF